MAENRQQVSNPIALIQRIQWGWSVEQCKSRINPSITPKQAERWQHTLSGAQVAFESLNLFPMASVAEGLSEWLAEIAACEPLDVLA
jgi:hypothetical protein